MAEAKRPTGPKGSFLFGNTFQYTRDPLGFLSQAAHDYGDVVRLRLANTTTYMLSHPKDIEAVLRTNHANYVKDSLTRMIMPVVGNGLLTSEGDFWRRQRKLATPPFQHQQIARYGTIMVEHTQRMLNSWHDGQPRDIHRDMMRLTLGIVSKTLFDADVAGDAEAVGESLEFLMDYYLEPTQWLPFRNYLPFPSTFRFHRAIRRLNEIVYGIIRRRQEDGRDPGDLLSRLLHAQDDDGGGMTDSQLRDEVVTLFLAGHETTALTLSFCFHLLMTHPECEAKLVAELGDVLGDRLPTVEDVPRLRYTEWVVRESMRLYPPAWSVGREALRDGEVGGYPFTKGTQFLMVQWVVHRDPRWFDEPEAFRPERWDNDFAKRLPRCAYFPFGDGPRICIGQHFAMMEAILILATVLQHQRVTLIPGQTFELIPSITLRPKAGIRVVPTSRQPVAQGA